MVLVCTLALVLYSIRYWCSKIQHNIQFQQNISTTIVRFDWFIYRSTDIFTDLSFSNIENS